MNKPLVTRILFATDLSDCAARAQAYATYLATAWEAKVDEVQGQIARSGITVNERQAMGIPNEQIDLVARLARS